MTLDLFFVALNLCGALAAVAVNAWDAARGWPDFRAIRVMIAALAAVYVAAYAVLLVGTATGTVDRAEWSRFVVGLGPVAWFLVWCGPPSVSRWVARKVKIGTARTLSVPGPDGPVDVGSRHPSRRHKAR